ncbi:MAG: iron uptake porin [Coleofasciculaceae cyanobacterium]
MIHRLRKVPLPNSMQSLYIGLLLAGTLAVPVAAQTPDSEIVPDLETGSAAASQTARESDLASAALAEKQEVRGDDVQLSPEESPETISVTPKESLAGLEHNTEVPVENSIHSDAALTQADPVISSSDRKPINSDNSPEVVLTSDALKPSDVSVRPQENLTELEQRTQTDTQESMTPVSDLAQADPAISPSEQDVLGVDDLQDAEADPMGQVTNVTELGDVRPTDWAYEALRSLVERYGCIAGYPDGTFRGNRAMSRYEFAAGLNACLQQIERLIANQGSNLASQEDIKTLQRLLEEFGTELATLKTRVDTLEGRTAFLEDHQFSTTTKLFGQVVVGVQGRTENEAVFFAGQKTRDPETNINVITNTQLSLFTQLGPRSILLTGLQAGSGFTGGLNPTFTRLGYEGPTNPDNNIVLSDLTFRHLFGRNFAVIVGTSGVNPVNVFRGANRVESAGFGPISAFAQRNPIINIGGSSGIGFDWQINPRISLQGVYSTDLAANPTFGGVFGGDRGRTTAGVQLAVTPINRLDIALNYINSYTSGGRADTGRMGMGVGDDQVTINAPLKTDAFGGTVSLRVTPRFTVGGWAGWTKSWIPGESGNVDTFNWMAFLNFPDLLGRGNLGGIYVGQPPKITSSDLPGSSATLPFGFNIPDLVNGTGNGNPGGQPGTATHVEAFYRFRLTDNISLTPGVVVVFDPAHNSNNDTITIGALRTTFTF